MAEIQKTKLDLEFDLCSELEAETQRRQYAWIDEAEGVSWQLFRSQFSKHCLWLYTLLDVSPDNGTGWQQLGLNFGLKTEDIQWCSQYCGSSGPTAAVFSKLRQAPLSASLTVHQLLHHFVSLGRHDLIRRIPWHHCLEQLKTDSIKSSDATVLHHQQHYSDNSVGVLSNIDAPLHSISTGAVGAGTVGAGTVGAGTGTVGAGTGTVGAGTGTVGAGRRHQGNKRPYGCSILLIFAEDARDFALKACAQLRESVDGQRDRIGVLLLSEQRHLLQEDPHNLIHKWFMQVDYIVPVLSPMLLHEFMSWSVPLNNEQPQFSLFHRYLYRLTLDQYVTQLCRNSRCRPICSSQHNRLVCSSDLVKTQGILQVVTVCKDYSQQQVFSNNNCNTNDAKSCLEANNGSNIGNDTLTNASLEAFAHLLLRSTPS